MCVLNPACDTHAHARTHTLTCTLVSPDYSLNSPSRSLGGHLPQLFCQLSGPTGAKKGRSSPALPPLNRSDGHGGQRHANSPLVPLSSGVLHSGMQDELELDESSNGEKVAHLDVTSIISASSAVGSGPGQPRAIISRPLTGPGCLAPEGQLWAAGRLREAAAEASSVGLNSLSAALQLRVFYRVRCCSTNPDRVSRSFWFLSSFSSLALRCWALMTACLAH